LQHLLQGKVDAFFICSLAIGLLLTFSGQLAQLLHVSNDNQDLMVYAGIGIVLATLGTVSLVAWRGITIVGAGAIMIALFLVFGHGREHILLGSLTSSQYMTTVTMLPAPFASSGVISFDKQGNPGIQEWHFAIRPSELATRGTVSITVEFRSGVFPTFPCIQESKIARYVGGSDEPQFNVDYDPAQITDVRTNEVLSDSSRSCDKTKPTDKRVTPSEILGTHRSELLDFPGLISRAFGQDLSAQFSFEPKDVLNFPNLPLGEKIALKRAISATLTRDFFLQEIALLKPFDPMENPRRIDPATTSILFGTISAWNDYFAAGNAPNIFATMDIPLDDLQFLAALTGYHDSEVRNNATLFLANYSVQRPESAKAVASTVIELVDQPPPGLLLARVNGLIILRSLHCRPRLASVVEPFVRGLSLPGPIDPQSGSVLDDIQKNRCTTL
jgi:hypothetical protein